MNNEEASSIDLRELLLVIFKNLWLIILIIAISGIGTGLFTSYGIQKNYESNTLFTVLSPSESNEAPTSSDVFRIGSELAKRYSIIAKSNTVIEATRVDLAPDIMLSERAIRDSFTVNSVNETDILRITVTYIEPEIAQKIAESVTNESMKIYEETYQGVAVESIDKADLNRNAVSPNLKLNVIIGSILGLMISIGIILLKEFLNRKIKSAKDIELYLNVPFFGEIPDFNKIKL